MNDLLFLALALLAVMITALRVKPHSYHACFQARNTHLRFHLQRALAQHVHCPNCLCSSHMDVGYICPRPPAPGLEDDQREVPKRFRWKADAFFCRNCYSWVLSDNLPDHIMMKFDHSTRLN